MTITPKASKMITEISPTPGDPALPESVRDASAILNAVDEAQAHALREWLRLSGENGAIPHRSSLRPERLVPALPATTLIGVDWQDGRPVFRPRIEGRMPVVAFGESRGRSFEQMYAPSHLEQVLPAFHEAAHRGRVTLTPVATRTGSGEPFVYTRLLLPFVDDTSRVVRILAVYGFDIAKLSTLSGPLDIGDVIPMPSTRRVMAGNLHLRTG